jgi:hypothetical protein
MAGAPLIQVKLRSSIAVTFHIAGGNFGCRMTARLPTRNGPASSRFTLRIEAVHSCQRSTSDMTDQTISGAAAISIDF